MLPQMPQYQPDQDTNKAYYTQLPKFDLPSAPQKAAEKSETIETTGDNQPKKLEENELEGVR